MACAADRGRRNPAHLVSRASVGFHRATRGLQLQAEEISYLANVANLLALTLQNVKLFQQVATVEQ
jgi:GAF domain-containing protein